MRFDECFQRPQEHKVFRLLPKTADDFTFVALCRARHSYSPV